MSSSLVGRVPGARDEKRAPVDPDRTVDESRRDLDATLIESGRPLGSRLGDAVRLNREHVARLGGTSVVAIEIGSRANRERVLVVVELDELVERKRLDYQKRGDAIGRHSTRSSRLITDRPERRARFQKTRRQ